MAGTTVAARSDAMAGGTTRATRVEHNKVIADLELLRAALALANTKINAIITAAATNIGAVAALPALTTTTVDAAGDLTAAVVSDENGGTT